MTENSINMESEPELPGIGPDGAIATVNERWDAPTLAADAVQGVMLSPFLVKISFLEHFFADEAGTIEGRFVANLVVPTPQLRAMANLFAQLADRLEQITEAEALNGE